MRKAALDLDLGPGLLPEMVELFEIIELFGRHVRVQELATVKHYGIEMPLLGLQIGSRDRTLPGFGLFGGVHGLERIGTRVVLAYLRNIAAQLAWDRHLQALLDQCRIVSIPIVNPLGMYLQRRANGNGIDLMRNAPVDADGIRAYHLHSGHRLSARLPWYRGAAGEPLQAEAQALCNFVETELFASPVAIAMDVHSGYGARDRLWFPYARTRTAFSRCPEVLLIKQLFEAAYPQHVYCIEPQSRQYVAHGDLWDHLFDEHQRLHAAGVFIPFTLEMGSWIWMKKSVRQIQSLFGLFNPIAVHRQRRTLRRHIALFDFLLRVTASPAAWTCGTGRQRDALLTAAQTLWYGTR